MTDTADTAEATARMTVHQPAVQLQEGHVVPCNSECDYRAAMEASGDRLVVVDCFASWCPPCQQMSPLVDALAKEYPHVVFMKVDVEQAPALKRELSVWALPTFVFFRYGKRVGSFMGANPSLLRRGLENNGEVSICSSLNCAVQ